MLRRMFWHVLLLAVFAAPGTPARAAEAYQVSTISSLLAGGYDGATTIGEMLRHGNFGLGTFNGVDGEMIVLDGQVYRATVDGRAHLVDPSELTPFAVVVPFQPQSTMAVAAGQSLDQLEAALDALPYSASRIFAARVEGKFQTIQIRSEPKQNSSLPPPGRGDQSGAGRPYAQRRARHPDRFSVPGGGELGQRGRLALPFSQRRQDAGRSRARPDHGRRPGAGAGDLGPADHISRQRSRILREPRIDQGGGASRSEERRVSRRRDGRILVETWRR